MALKNEVIVVQISKECSAEGEGSLHRILWSCRSSGLSLGKGGVTHRIFPMEVYCHSFLRESRKVATLGQSMTKELTLRCSRSFPNEVDHGGKLLQKGLSGFIGIKNKCLADKT